MKNKKGFTLVELIVSFALVTVISLAFFKTILSLQEQQLLNIAKNKFTSFTVIMNNSIQKDFMNDRIEKVISCGDNCYDITYTTNGIIRLSVEENIINYGNVKEKIPTDYKLIGNIKFTSYTSDIKGIDSYISLNMNLKSNFENKIESIKYVYQYDIEDGVIELDVDGAEASDVIEYLLYKAPKDNGLYEPLLPDGTSTGIRYYGEKPNNYVYFNCDDTYNDILYGDEGYDYKNACEVWRIIGVFDVDDGKGNVEKRLKLVNMSLSFDASWDSSANTINSGWGINEWSQSDIKEVLNNYYAGNSETCLSCSQMNQATCSNDCTSILKKLNTVSLNMMDNALWHTGGFAEMSMAPSEVYIKERPTVIGKNGEGTGKTCVQGTLYCSDTVERGIQWVGKVALIYPSDFGFAGGDICKDITNSSCGMINWLGYQKHHYWTISANSSSAAGMWRFYDSYVIQNSASLSSGILPSLYLKSSVTFVGEGDGTEEYPYILGINE